jgi:hypothetical protein
MGLFAEDLSRDILSDINKKIKVMYKPIKALIKGYKKPNGKGYFWATYYASGENMKDVYPLRDHDKWEDAITCAIETHNSYVERSCND